MKNNIEIIGVENGFIVRSFSNYKKEEANDLVFQSFAELVAFLATNFEFRNKSIKGD